MDKSQLVQDALQKAVSYNDYFALVTQHMENASSTGAEITDAFINYTQLNHRRMKRWNKTFKLLPEEIIAIETYQGNVTWLVITESWCGDAAQTMPMMAKIAETSQGKIDLKVVLRDENLELMDAFLTNGARSIAKLIVINNVTGKVVGEWGPRPEIATQIVINYKTEHGKLTAAFREDLHKWYTKDKGRNTTAGLLKLLNL